ncbi:MAG: hypothetical protein EXQ71_06105 [Acidimicrobiia bacterium]|nr:hypothetical protein [Acidimicrobiia bacterium]
MADSLEGPEGGALWRVTGVGTGVLVVSSGVVAVVPDLFGPAYAAISCLFFLVGTVALLWAFARGISRSRLEEVTIPGLFLLSAPAAPPAVRRRFRRAVVLEMVVVVVVAALHPFTEVAFGVLAPLFGLGCMALWGGRYAHFEDRPGPQSA